MIKYAFVLTFLLAIVWIHGEASASTSLVVYPDEGNPGCKQVLTNNINELKDSMIEANSTKILQRLDQEIEYSISEDGSSLDSFAATQPVNAVIVRGLSTLIYHYGSGGTRRDKELPAPSGQQVASVTFCWGLKGVAFNPAFRACPPDVLPALKTNDALGDFVAYIIDPNNTQSKPIQCVNIPSAQAQDCDYLSSGNNPCDMSGLFAPQSIDIYEGSLTSCNTSGGLVRCNRIAVDSTPPVSDLTTNSSFAPCPPDVLPALMTTGLGDFVAYIIDPQNTQSKPIQCVNIPSAQAQDCAYLSSGPDSCDVGGLTAPQSIDIYESSLTSCNTSGGLVRCNSIK